jgi:hypothetical protein
LKKSGLKNDFVFSIDILLKDSKSKNATYRSTYNDFELKNPENIKKEVIQSYNNKPINEDGLYNNLTYKLNLSTETPSSITIGLKNKTLIRIKRRYSFYLDLWRIDITRVITTLNINDQTNESYEIECEYIGKTNFNQFLQSMNYLYKVILKNTSYC